MWTAMGCCSAIRPSTTDLKSVPGFTGAPAVDAGHGRPYTCHVHSVLGLAVAETLRLPPTRGRPGCEADRAGGAIAGAANRNPAAMPPHAGVHSIGVRVQAKSWTSAFNKLALLSRSPVRSHRPV